MLLKEALQLIENICSGYQGTLKDHQMIQQALSVIKSSIKEQDAEKEDKTDK